MANEAKIDHIEVDGVDYEFVDAVARSNIASVGKRINDNDDKFTQMINDEETRAKAAEKALEDSKVSRTAGKGLSTNDLTDELLTRIENPPVFKGATSTLNGENGVVPRPMIAEKEKFLKGDGTWAVPHDTTYSTATHDDDGLMSSDDKYKLDTMDADNDNLMDSVTTFNDNVIREVIGNGKVKTTTFNADGSITQVIQKTGVAAITLVTEFRDDGSIVRTRS